MANQTKIQFKRTGNTGVIPATGTVIDVGEIAINYIDHIAYSTDGIVTWEIGSNTTNSQVQDTLTVNKVQANNTLGANGQVLTSNGTSVYWETPSDVKGYGFYRGNNGEIGAVTNKDNIFRVNSNTINTDIMFQPGENGLAVGPLEMANTILMNIPVGSRIVII